MEPQLAIIHIDTVPAELFDDFRLALASDNLDLQIISRKQPDSVMASEWLIPTFVFAFIAKSYFDGFLKEMGKDHYISLKSQLKKLYTKVLGPQAPDVHLISTSSNSPANQPYSLYFSIVGEDPDGIRLKLLVKRHIEKDEYERIVSEFLDFLEDLNIRKTDVAKVDRFRSVRVIDRTVLLVYDEELQQITPIDPVSGRLMK